MTDFTINVAKDFHTKPWGRTLNDDPERSAAIFVKNHLLPALEMYDQVTVDFSNTKPGSSFLEEAFGGLIRSNKFTKSQLDTKLKITHKTLPSIKLEVEEYIKKAALSLNETAN